MRFKLFLNSKRGVTLGPPLFVNCCYTFCILYFPLLLRILHETTLYSGHMASVSCSSLVIMFSIISGKWKVELKIPGFISSVTLALISTLPLGDYTHTMSPSSMPFFVASSAHINKTSSIKISTLPVLRVMAPQL